MRLLDSVSNTRRERTKKEGKERGEEGKGRDMLLPKHVSPNVTHVFRNRLGSLNSSSPLGHECTNTGKLDFFSPEIIQPLENLLF